MANVLTPRDPGDENDRPVTRPFLVQWEIELDAMTPEEAVREAILIMRDRTSIASNFLVEDMDAQETVGIDADEDWHLI
jgi:hypothetical protein